MSDTINKNGEYNFANFGVQVPTEPFYKEPIDSEYGMGYIRLTFGNKYRQPVGEIWCEKGANQTHQQFTRQFFELFKRVLGFDFVPKGRRPR